MNINKYNNNNLLMMSENMCMCEMYMCICAVEFNIKRIIHN